MKPEVAIQNVHMNYTYVADGGEVSYKNVLKQPVKLVPTSVIITYALLFEGVSVATGDIEIHDNDQDTYTSIDHLTFNDFKFLVANRLGFGD